MQRAFPIFAPCVPVLLDRSLTLPTLYVVGFRYPENQLLIPNAVVAHTNMGLVESLKNTII